MGQVVYQTWTGPDAPNYSGHEMQVWLRMQCVKVVYVKPLFDPFLEYVKGYGIAAALKAPPLEEGMAIVEEEVKKIEDDDALVSEVLRKMENLEPEERAAALATMLPADKEAAFAGLSKEAQEATLAVMSAEQRVALTEPPQKQNKMMIDVFMQSPEIWMPRDLVKEDMVRVCLGTIRIQTKMFDHILRDAPMQKIVLKVNAEKQVTCQFN